MLNWNVRNQDGVVIFDLIGEFCVYHVAKLKEALALVREKGATKVLFNLEQVEFIDSTGIQFVLNTSRDFKKEKIHFLIAAPSSDVMETLKLTRAERFLEIHTSVSGGLQILVQK